MYLLFITFALLFYFVYFLLIFDTIVYNIKAIAVLHLKKEFCHRLKREWTSGLLHFNPLSA